MIQVSDQWLDAKRELLISEYRASHDIMTGLWNKTSGVDQVRNCLEICQKVIWQYWDLWISIISSLSMTHMDMKPVFSRFAK